MKHATLTRLESVLSAALVLLALVSLGSTGHAQQSGPARPVFVDGQAQVVEAFSDAEQWIQHDLWVETTFGRGRRIKIKFQAGWGKINCGIFV